MKIGFKLTVIMILLSLAGAGAVGVVLFSRAYSSIKSLSHDKAVSLSKEYANEISNLFTAYWYTTDSTSMFMEQYEDVEPRLRRPIFNTILQGMLEDNPEILGAWCAWEPDALEGGDLEYVGTAGSSETGRFIPYWHRTETGIAVEPLEDLDSSEYYLASKLSGKQALIEPYLYEVGRKTVLMTSITAPIFSRGKLVGVTGIDINLDKIQEMSKNNVPFGANLTAVFSNRGTVVAHFDESRIGKDMRETEMDMTGPFLNDMVQSIKDGRPYYLTNYVSAIKTKVDVIITPFTAGNSTSSWSYVVAIPYRTVMAPVYRMLYLSIIVSVVVLALVTLTAMILSRSISRPIVRVTQTLKDISEGEGDLTKTIVVSSKDEIGSLSHYFNQTLGKIKDLVISIKNEASTLSEIGNDLASNMTETSSAVNEIAANVQSIKNRIINQSASVTQTNSTMENVALNISKLNDHIEDQSSNISQASSAIEEMVANIRSVTGTLVNNASNVDTLRQASDVGRAGIQEVAADIKEIARESEGIMAINSVMKDIASQTNLLSMNAAIEAAHAGNAGKGFAVVAEEIRKLAESSDEQSKTISAVLSRIKGAIDKITQSIGTVLQKFEAIDSSVRIVADQEENIRSAMEEQGEGSKQILAGLSNVKEITQRVKSGSNEMHSGAQEVIKEGQNLEEATQEITSGMSEMAIGTEQINTAVLEVNDISIKNREGINTLIREVSRFKVE